MLVIFILSLLVILIEYPLFIRIVKRAQITQFRTMMFLGFGFYVVKAFSISAVITLIGTQGNPFQFKTITNSFILMLMVSRQWAFPYLICFALMAYVISWHRRQELPQREDL